MKPAFLSWVAAALVVAVNLIALGGAAWNRQGAASAELALSERELHLPPHWQPRRVKENSGLALRLAWRVVPPEGATPQLAWAPYNPYNREAAWLDEARLGELGFALPPTPAGDNPGAYWRRPLPRPAWLVLELDGESYRKSLAAVDAWATWVRAASDAEIAKTIHTRPDAAQVERERRDAVERHSRLFVIDSGPDPVALRQRYPDHSRHAIVSGRVRAHYGSHRVGQATSWRGHIEALDVDFIHVSTRWRGAVDAVKGTPYDHDDPPRYQTRVRWGARYEPWLLDFQAADAEP